jgi:cell division protein FtsL
MFNIKDLYKMTLDLGIDPIISLALLILLATFLIIMAVLYICVPFFLLKIRKEIIEINKNLRTLHIIDSKAKTDKKNEVVRDDNDFIYDKKISKNNKKLQLDDEDIKKLKAIGAGMK